MSMRKKTSGPRSTHSPLPPSRFSIEGVTHPHPHTRASTSPAPIASLSARSRPVFPTYPGEPKTKQIVNEKEKEKRRLKLKLKNKLKIKIKY